MKISLFKIIYKKELRSGRMIDVIMISFVSILTVYSGTHIFIPLLILLMSDRFLYPLWNRKEEQLIFALIGDKSVFDILYIHKIILIAECNMIFILFCLILKGFLVSILQDIIIFNCYILFFLVLSDYVFLKSKSIDSKNKKHVTIGILLVTSLCFSISFSIIGYYTDFLILSILTFVFFIGLNIKSTIDFSKKINLKQYFKL